MPDEKEQLEKEIKETIEAADLHPTVKCRENPDNPVQVVCHVDLPENERSEYKDTYFGSHKKIVKKKGQEKGLIVTLECCWDKLPG